MLVGAALVAIPTVGMAVTYTCTGNPCNGTSNSDTITDSTNHVMNSAMGGNYGYYDYAYGHDLGDNIEGSNDPDDVRGQSGNDLLTIGHNYEDVDYAFGREGNDTIKDEWPGVGFDCGTGCDKDRLCGYDGSDNLYLRDGDEEDKYHAGNGDDYVEKDGPSDVNVDYSTCVAGAPGG